MKKFTIILAALFAANMVNAQITLEHTFDYNLRVPHAVIDENGETMGDLMAYYDNETLVCIDALSYDEIARITIPGMKRYDMIAKNIYSTDGLIGFFARETESKGGRGNAYIYNQNGIKLADLGVCYFVSIVKLSSGYKLVVYRNGETLVGKDEYENPLYTYHYSTDIYSLPGNGDASVGVMSPVSPRRSSTRKYLHNDQVLIENADHTYTMQGQEVK